MHSILVGDYMDNNPHAINDDKSVRDAVKFLLGEKLSGAPVVDINNNLVGFVSEQDCITGVLNDAFYCDEAPNISSVMVSEVKSTTPESSIVELAQEIANNNPSNYPVVKNGKLVGIISRHTVLKAILENGEDCYLHH